MRNRKEIIIRITLAVVVGSVWGILYTQIEDTNFRNRILYLYVIIVSALQLVWFYHEKKKKKRKAAGPLPEKPPSAPERERKVVISDE
ncbi:hypothetical protein OKA04_12155 [Luteolibacter flavescens]|uniref:Uncharacterized protein n=1 Tax=Luteolibacter flavescens TaxID=1859460 RepID=A0ABT3FPK0_9BACT|nr:hypothetical protein [Luteolibacter flavescens]MCW1885483.1 hypothetical protein [Luteolibacter flavescens]